MPRVCRGCGRTVEEAAYCPFCSEPTIEQFPVHLGQSNALTIRKLFNRKKQRIMMVGFGCFLGFLGGLLAKVIAPNISFPFFAPFFAGCLIITLYTQLFAFRCPRCEKNWGMIASRYGPFEIDNRIQFCPFCGLDIDVEIDPESHQPKEFLETWRGSGLEIKNSDIQLPPGIQKGNTDIQLPSGKEESGEK